MEWPILLFFTRIPFVVNHTINAMPTERLQQHPFLFTTNRTDCTFFLLKQHLARSPHPGHSTTLLTCPSLWTCMLNRWILFTLSCEMAKALLRLAAAWDTKQVGHLKGDTVQFIAPTLASHVITHNGNIYWPLAQTATCLYHDEETNISQKTVDRSVRQLARDTTQKEEHAKLHEVVNTCAEMQAEKCIQHKVWLLSHVIHTNAVSSVNMWTVCAQQDQWLNEQSMRWF